MNKAIHCKVDVDGVDIHYREAGPKDAPALLLLHGFPTAGHMFRDLMPLLCDRYRVVAPDFPGFGQSDMPESEAFRYTFANIAKAIARFTEIVELHRFAMYVFDYGAPVGVRLALENPERITAVITQNGNVYDEGLSDAWAPVRDYWQDPSDEHRKAVRHLLSPSNTYRQYTSGVPNPLNISPDGYSLDQFYMERHDAQEAQLDLLLDYATNLQLYPRFHSFLRDRKVPVLAVWGKNDPLFLPAGAVAYKRDAPDAEINFYDTGHFALETHAVEIARAVDDFLTRRLAT